MSAETERHSTYHAGERYVQDRAGQVAAATAAIGAIHPMIPPAAAGFLGEREMLVVAASDADGRVWASQLTGAPGFVRVIDERTVRVDALPGAHDPLLTTLAGIVHVGTIAIDFATRRRMRINGTAAGDQRGITIATDQVYANCPKFIAARSVEAVVDSKTAEARVSDRLDAEARALVMNADTFFVGTVHDRRGADASHRGGPGGFVEVLDARTLRWPDYRGNAMYMTLGNIVATSRTGLLFSDWERGDALQLTGVSAIDWDSSLAARFPGAQRMVTFSIEHAVRTRNASPLRWSKPVASRVNPPLTY